MEATQELSSSLIEVESLITLAEAEETPGATFSALLKAALVLLAGKFEAFCENIMEEYIYNLNSLGALSSDIPVAIRAHHSSVLVKDLDRFIGMGNHERIEIKLSEVAKLWSPSEYAPNVSVRCEFSYGKHGEKELIKLFSRIGIPDVFESAAVYRKQESLYEQEVVDLKIDFKGTFNSVTNIRNNILHQDESPGLTIDQLREYKSFILAFSSSLEEALSTELKSIRSRNNH